MADFEKQYCPLCGHGEKVRPGKSVTCACGRWIFRHPSIGKSEAVGGTLPAGEAYSLRNERQYPRGGGR